MEKIKYYIEKYKFIILISIISLIILLIVLSLLFKKEENIIIEKSNELKIENKEKIKEEIKKVKVDVKGAVINPGVYELDEGSRILDAINKAGGLFEYSNTEYLNLSKKLEDEMVLIIYTNDEVDKFKETDKEIIYIEYECVCPDNINDGCITEDSVVNTNGTSSNAKEDNIENNNIVSINKGSLEDLMTLSGIGESKAQAIIEYREKNGNFKKLEDIMNVSGIGESAYSKIKDNIKL